MFTAHKCLLTPDCETDNARHRPAGEPSLLEGYVLGAHRFYALQPTPAGAAELTPPARLSVTVGLPDAQDHERRTALMNDERRLIEKLLRIEALFAGATTEGEKSAAASAAERLRKRLDNTAKTDLPVEYRFSVADGWSRKLLLALLRRYGIQPYRYRTQRRTTVMARVSRRFVEETLWPEFVEFDRALQAFLNDVTERVIRKAIGPDGGDEEVLPDEPGFAGSDGPRNLPLGAAKPAIDKALHLTPVGATVSWRGRTR